jgi:hypothetical protein
MSLQEGEEKTKNLWEHTEERQWEDTERRWLTIRQEESPHQHG